jgi:hypothetical protein
MNCSLAGLHKSLWEERELTYCYVIETIKRRGTAFVQTGSGPNFQGGRITLCTCKHWMRTFLAPKDWVGKWIAGFTGREAGDGKNYLVYLMKVRLAFESQYALWHSGKIPEATRRAKAASHSIFGDLFQPKKGGSAFNPDSYLQPVSGHVHQRRRTWRKDIRYCHGCSGRPPALLVGDVSCSFLWNTRLIAHKGRLHRGQKKYLHLTDLLNDLISNEQV